MARSRGREGSSGARESRCFAGHTKNEKYEDPKRHDDVSVLNNVDSVRKGSQGSNNMDGTYRKLFLASCTENRHPAFDRRTALVVGPELFSLLFQTEALGRNAIFPHVVGIALKLRLRACYQASAHICFTTLQHWCKYCASNIDLQHKPIE